ncbi:hypothetical protein MTYP_02489 [Methylophilaceae bacterium]|nr:hypothetical protein MTYP_02489 [Methylophilaceae bacterium]
MRKLNNLLLKVRNLKCFEKPEQGFEGIKLINLIIGRNNSGKSTLLDLIENVIKGEMDVPQSFWHAGQVPEIIAELPLSEEELMAVFPEGTSGGEIRYPYSNHWQFGKKLIGAKFRWRLERTQNRFISIGDCLDGSRPIDEIQNISRYMENLANRLGNPFSGKVFRRIFAERNIEPEPDNNNLGVTGDGRGVSNLIQNFLTKARLPSHLVEVTLLNELNAVFKTDARFTSILCQHLDNNTWEIYLEEEHKGRIPLSQSGSGLKTIILILVYIHLVPIIEKKALSNFVFGFEELENNLHPALLRRLLSYIYQQAKTQGCIFFLTTHSNVEIDLFSKCEDAQIIHVKHDKQRAYCRTVKTYIENRGILDDLDVRASDLLQSNCLIWVEGPSDRIYLNRWIELWSDGKLSEGNHYQCVFYGGRLLSHLSSEEPGLVHDAVAILNVNKNFAILIDSDKHNKAIPLNATKKRIINEVESNGGFVWVTKGKEIENYISAGAISNWLNEQGFAEVGQYENFFDYLDNIRAGEGQRYSSRKPLLAELLVPNMTSENIAGVLDLTDKLEGLCNAIKKWNSL